MNNNGGLKKQKNEHKKAEYMINNEKRVRSIIEQIPLGYQSLNIDGYIIDVNERWLTTLGYKREEVVGHWFGDFLTLKSVENFKRSFILYKKSGELHDVELEMVKKDGSLIIISFYGRVGYDEKGNFKQTHSIMSNITERKRIEKLLIESEEKYRNIYENAMVGIFQSLPEGGFVSINPAMARIHGYNSPDQMMKDVTDITKQLYVCPDERNKWRKLVEEHNNIRGFEAHLYRKDRSKVWISMNVRTVRDAEGRLLYYEGIVEDITERKQAEEKLKKSQEKLKALAVKLAETEEIESRRLAQELHDKLGQNLTAIGINLNIIKSKIPDGVKESIGSHISDSMVIVEQTAGSVRDLMAELRTPVMDDYGLVAALRWYGQQYFGRTGIQVTVQGKEPDPRLEDRVEQTMFRIVQEALNNTAKHAKAGKVAVRLEERNSVIKLSVKDDGIGFEYHHPITKERRKTLRGYGLMIMNERAEAIGGNLYVESSPSKGTKIVVEVKR